MDSVNGSNPTPASPPKPQASQQPGHVDARSAEEFAARIKGDIEAKTAEQPKRQQMNAEPLPMRPEHTHSPFPKGTPQPETLSSPLPNTVEKPLTAIHMEEHPNQNPQSRGEEKPPMTPKIETPVHAVNTQQPVTPNQNITSTATTTGTPHARHETTAPQPHVQPPADASAARQSQPIGAGLFEDRLATGNTKPQEKTEQKFAHAEQQPPVHGQANSPTQTAATNTVTAVPITMSSNAAEVDAALKTMADQIMVSARDAVRGAEVRITLKNDVLPGTELRVHRHEGQLTVTINTFSAESGNFMAQHEASLQKMLSERFTNERIQVNIELDNNQSESEGGSRNEYLPDEPTPDDER